MKNFIQNPAPHLNYCSTWFRKVIHVFLVTVMILHVLSSQLSAQALPILSTYDYFGNGQDYDFTKESALQPNYYFRWPLPFVDGQFEVRVKVHYINFHTNTPPTSHIQQAKDHIQTILNQHDLYIDYQSDEVHNVFGGYHNIRALQEDFFGNPPVALADNVIHIAIFDKDLVSFEHANMNGTILDASHTPTRNVAVGYPELSDPDVLNASFAGARDIFNITQYFRK